MDEQNSLERIQRVDIENQMKTSYIDYAMSVIVSRALPDARDGLKPVHRRVLYAMQKLGLNAASGTKKSARIVGDVIGKYHPHGDSSVYDALVRMAQPWSLRYELVKGQGNFGSVDGDGPAAMRYTEASMERITEEVMRDIEMDTVDFMPNFDEETTEPTVLPTRVPLLLVNGASGIAVGMATNMAPHNLGEVIDATCAYIDNRDIDVDGLMEHVKGPDFPTGAMVYGMDGVREAFRTGRGRIMVRSKAEIDETKSGRLRIVVTEIPYQVNKADLIRRIAELVNEKKIEGISYINDESDRNGMRIVILLKRDAVPNVVLNNLYKHTALQSSFSVNNIALVDGRPRLLNLKDMIAQFVLHRHDVVMRRTRYQLKKDMERMHILEGLLIALDHIDEVIRIIRASQSPREAMDQLQSNFGLSEVQSQAIVDMRLRALTGLERDKLHAEHEELAERIAYLNRLLEDKALQDSVMKEELQEVKAKYGDGRRTEIIPTAEEFSPEDFYPDDDVVITLSHLGYIKRTNLAEYRSQRRGGRGAKGSATREEDFIEHLYNTTMHNTLIFFTEKGLCYWLKVYDVPEGARNTKGRSLQNLINIEQDDKVRAILNVRHLNDREYTDSHYVIMCTKSGVVKKTCLTEYSRPRTNGLIAVAIREEDELLDAVLTDGQSDLILASHGGMAIRFKEEDLRPLSRKSMGVRGMDLAEGDFVIGMVSYAADDPRKLLVVSDEGYCKRSEVAEYRTIHRGGKGVKTINVEKAGMLVNISLVDDEEHLMIISKNGVIIRFPVAQTPLASRNTKGVHCITLGKKDTIASISPVSADEDEDEEPLGEEAQEGATTTNDQNEEPTTEENDE
ncbi:MAG: DNA gyrase subunit A [Bacteroidetes bacterium]|nr:MAG: DNA gyrase subunit A [Bacteroidota bacterium]